MIKLKSNIGKTIYPSLKSVSDDANSNFYLMELENEQTKRKTYGVLNKGLVDDRAVELKLNKRVLDWGFNTIGFINASKIKGFIETGYAWTMAVWFRHNPTTDGEYSIFTADDDVSPASMEISLFNGRVKVENYYNNIWQSDEKFDDGNWHRLVLTQPLGTNKKIKVYVDGQHLATTNTTHLFSWTNFDNYGIGVNVIPSPYANYYEGNLYNFQLWNAEWKGDDVKFDYNYPDNLVTERSGTEVNDVDFKVHYLLDDSVTGSGGADIINLVSDNLFLSPNDFKSNNWTKTNAKVDSDVAETRSGFKIADKITFTNSGDVPFEVSQQVTAPEQGTYYFSVWVKATGSVIGKNGRLRNIAGTGTIYDVPTRFTYTGEWQEITSYAYVGVGGTYTPTLECIKEVGAQAQSPIQEKGDAIYVYGAKVKPPFDTNASRIVGLTVVDLTEPKFSFDDNTFYKYKIYEQTDQSNINIYDDSVLGLRDQGKLFVEGDAEAEYIKQKDADSTNEVYLEI